jgi:hypothetical protein
MYAWSRQGWMSSQARLVKAQLVMAPLVRARLILARYLSELGTRLGSVR